MLQRIPQHRHADFPRGPCGPGMWPMVMGYLRFRGQLMRRIKNLDLFENFLSLNTEETVADLLLILHEMVPLPDPWFN